MKKTKTIKLNKNIGGEIIKLKKIKNQVKKCMQMNEQKQQNNESVIFLTKHEN